MFLQKLKLNLFGWLVLCFLGTELLAVFAGYSFLAQKGIATVAAPDFQFGQFLLGFLIVTLLIIGLLKFTHSGFLFQFFFYFALWTGIWSLFDLVLPIVVAALFACWFIIARIVFPQVWLQNLNLVLGLAGISFTFGLGVPVTVMILLLLFFSFYDVIAVFATKHMVTLFRGLLSRGAVFAIIVPEKFSQFFTNLKDVQPGGNFLFLGTGDLVFPAVFAVSALREGIAYSIAICLGSLVGLFLLHLFFVLSEKKKPLPALPLLALGSIAGFFIASFLF